MPYYPIFENELVRCELNEDIPVLKHRWLKKPTSQEFENGLLKVREQYVELVKLHPGLKWLADTEMLGQLTEEDESWLENDWDRLLFEEAGVKVHAVILGNDIFADYSMEKFKESADKKFKDSGVKLNVFLDENSATEWLIAN